MANYTAIMQPYFFPYGGYYRLLAATRRFVVFDCVQFPRRGRVHRMQEPEQERWITLSTEKAPQTARICDIKLKPASKDRIAAYLTSIGAFDAKPTPLRSEILERLRGAEGPLAPFLRDLLCVLRDHLQLECDVLLSSQLDQDPGLKAQDRILEIMRQVGGSTYVNSPGGRHLYDMESFRRAGFDLMFLAEYHGQIPAMLPAIFRQDAEDLRQDIMLHTKFASS